LEGAGRLWLQVPETDRLGAQTAVQRLLDAFDVAEPLVAGTVAGGADPAERYFAALSAHAPPSGPRRNGARLELAIGSAVCPVDGQDVAALVDRASSELAVMRNGKRPGVALAGPA
jgi:hypothetical protein